MDEILLTMAEAAEKTGVAKSTISRARAAGEFPNAQLKEGKQWLIPVSDLINSGRLDTVKSSSEGQDSIDGAPDAHEYQALLHKLELTEQRAEMLQQQVVHAQSLIEAKNEALEGYKKALRAIEARNPETGTSESGNEPSDRTVKEAITPASVEPRLLKRIRRFFR